MRKVSFVILFIFIILGISAEGLEVRSFAIDNLDMHGSVSPVVDSNGDNCALIRIEHNLAGDVHLFDVEVFKREKKGNNIIYFYISKWEQYITISIENYLPIKYSFPINLKPEKTYVLRLYGDGEGDELEDIPVTIITEPAGATVYINKIRLKGVSPVSDFFIPGTYPIRIELDEYVVLNSQINISGSKVEESYVLEPDFGELEIISLPEVNMAVYLDESLIGKTPVKLERCKSGSHTLRFEHIYYSCAADTIYIERSKAMPITLNPIPEFGNLEIVTEPEKNLTVFINEDSTGNTPLQLDKFALGKYKIRAENEFYTTETENIVLSSGETQKIILTPISEFGELVIVSEPEVNLDVIINKNNVGKTPLTLKRQLKGKYTISGQHELYIIADQTIDLKPDSTVQVIFQAEQNFGTVNIKTLPGAIVYLNEKEITKLVDVKLTPRTLNLRAELAKHHPAHKKGIILIGDTLDFELYPVPMTGTILVNPEPKDAKVTLSGDSCEYYEDTGICRFSDIPIGKYELKITQPQYLPYEATIELVEGDKKKIEPQLLKAELGFSVNIPQELENELEVAVFDKDMQKVKLYKVNNDYLVDKAGFYSLSIMKGKNMIYQKAIQITSSNKPEITPYFRRYETPSKISQLYLNSKLTDRGKYLVLASDDEINTVKFKIPGYAGFCRKDTLKMEYSDYELKLGKDYYKRWYGIGLVSNEEAVFYGIKLPIFYSPVYKEFNGIAVNWLLGGSVEIESESDVCTYDFNGIAIGGIGVGANNFNGIAIGGFGVKTDNFNGIAIGGLAGSENFHGISIGGGNFTKNELYGVQIGFYNHAGELHGIQIGLWNDVDNGPDFPLINIQGIFK